MTDSNIIKTEDVRKEHLVEEYSFSALYDDKHSDMEANNIDIIATRNNLIKEHKDNYSNAAKDHIMAKRKDRDINILQSSDENISPQNTNNNDNNNNVQHKETINADSLSNIEKKISDKIDSSLSIINELKQNIDNININNQGNPLSDEEKQASYKKGFDDGIQQTIDNFKSDYEADRNRLIQTLSNIASHIENANSILDALEGELSKASINIANEVIAKEVENDSAKVALHLAKTLISDIKDAGKISLKVSPYDYEFIVNNFSHPEVEIVNDMSVAKGGVIILSDMENIDGSIAQRLGNIKMSLES